MRQRWLAVLPVIVALAAGACESAPTSPAAPRAPAVRAAFVSGGYLMCGPSYCATLLTGAGSASQTRTATIGYWGGKINFGATSLQIPAGAVAGPTKFTFVLKTQPYMAAELHALPVGSTTEIHTFNGRTLTLTLSYAGTNVAVPDPTRLHIYYIADGQLVEAMNPQVDVKGKKLIVEIGHFSEYVPGTETLDNAGQTGV